MKIDAPQTNVFRGKADLGTMGHMRRNAERKPSFCSNNTSPVTHRTEKLLPQACSPASRAQFQVRDGVRGEPSPCSLLRGEEHIKIQILARRRLSA
ncbi:MAG: hypothetical protein L7F78_08995, partial [Syntrophales bacterium LBB04]|nr:hypothetical protein [Syntrophales bacterium LBB04]